MFEIIESKQLSADVRLFRIRAPRIARKQRAGQFVILRVHEHGERIPLTIAGSDPEEGTVTIIVQGIGKTTKLMNSLEKGDFIRDIVGPLGKPTEAHRYGTVVVIGGGVGTAIAYPSSKAFKEAGNTVVSIIGARTKDLVILEEEMRAISDQVFISTDDGSYGTKGLVTDRLSEIIASGTQVDLVLAIGPIPMMRAVAETTRPHGIKTVVSLNAVMVDGTGMCGGCRVTVAGKPQFACVDGPEFDAHEVDFKVLAQRTAMYRDLEKQALARFETDSESEISRTRDNCRLLRLADELTEEATR